MKHTPTPRPWKHIDGAILSNVLNDYGNFIVAEVPLRCEQDKRNAAHIVACVNSHERLLRSCQTLLEICRWKCGPNDEVVLKSGQTNHSALLEAFEALRLAGTPEITDTNLFHEALAKAKQ